MYSTADDVGDVDDVDKERTNVDFESDDKPKAQASRNRAGRNRCGIGTMIIVDILKVWSYDEA